MSSHEVLRIDLSVNKWKNTEGDYKDASAFESCALTLMLPDIRKGGWTKFIRNGETLSKQCRLISFLCTLETWAALEGCYNICFLSTGYARKKKARSALSITDSFVLFKSEKKACDSFGVPIVRAHYCNKADLCCSRFFYKENCQWPTAVLLLMYYYKGIKYVGGWCQGYRSTVRKTAVWKAGLWAPSNKLSPLVDGWISDRKLLENLHCLFYCTHWHLEKIRPNKPPHTL